MSKEHQSSGTRAMGLSRCFLFALSACCLLSPVAFSAEPPVPSGTAKMAALLERINRAGDANPMQNLFANEARAKWLRAHPTNTTEVDRLVQASRVGLELLKAGEPEEALAELNRAAEMAKRIPGLPSRLRGELEFSIAMSHLRRGEQDNCLALHGPESCLLPIRPSAVHKDQTGSRAAIVKLSDILSRRSDTLLARWLMNIAYMTVGEYPDKVPSQWLIPPKAFASDREFPRFPNIAANLDLALEGLAGGVVSDDFDNDGDIDLMISEWGLRDQLRFFVNNGNGTFSERTREAGLTGLVGGLNMVQADYNNDGYVDVFLLRGAWMGLAGEYPNSLLRNNGNGTFEDVTEQANVLSFHPTQTATWFDYNSDGRIDLFIGNESSAEKVHLCELYRNNGDGTFSECAAQAGVAISAFVKAVVSGDYDNDGRPDLYVSIRGGTNILFRNEGPAQASDSRSAWRFRDITSQAGVGEPFFSFSTWFFDYDNDGWQDLFVGGYQIRDAGDIAADYLGLPHQAERARLFRNNGNGTFTDMTKPAGLYRILHTMGCNFGDLDNDGYLDFYLGTGDPDLATVIPNRMFHNAGGRKFEDVTTAAGVGHLQKGHAVAFVDLDNDGDQDVYASIGGAYSGDIARNVLFENPGTTNQWIGLKLEGVQSNRSAIGARIKITAQTPSGERTIYKTVNSGGSFGANPLRQHVGIGSGSNLSVEIFWPASGKTQVFTNLPARTWYHIREDVTKPAVMPVKSFKFAAQVAAVTPQPRGE